jgi:hypothetical protein
VNSGTLICLAVGIAIGVLLAKKTKLPVVGGA